MRLASLTLVILIGTSGAATGESLEIHSRSSAVVQGEFVGWNDREVTLRPKSNATPVSMLLSETLVIRLADTVEPAPTMTQVWTMDGGRIVCQNFTSDGKQAILETRTGRRFSVAVPRLAGVFQQPVDKSERRRLLYEGQGRSQDLLFVRKDEKRLEMIGLVTRVDADQAHFQLDGEEIPVARQRIWGWVYANRPTGEEVVAEISDRDGALWPATALRFREKTVVAQVFQQEVEFTAGELTRIDFSRGKLTYLSDLEPTVASSEPLVDTVWPYQRDRRILGGPLRLGKQTFEKGLALHSRTQLQYPLQGRYREFRATVGIDTGAGPYGDCIVRFRVDDKVVEEQRLRAGAEPITIVIPVVGADHFTLEVDFGEGLDLGDHVLFGDARLLK